MEFIPLKKPKKSKTETVAENKPKGFNRKGKIEEELPKKGKKKLRAKIIDKKVVKNKRTETVTKRKVLQKAVKKKKRKENEYEEEEEHNAEDEGQEDINDGSDIDQEESEASESANEDEEEVFRRKCNEMDEKKKNRLFVKLKKKILNEMQIKELHPDIRSVIFPRKKNVRWCWAVFASQEKATKAMKNLIKNKDIIVSKPTPYEKVEKKRKERMETILRKKQAKKKLQELWM